MKAAEKRAEGGPFRPRPAQKNKAAAPHAGRPDRFSGFRRAARALHPCRGRLALMLSAPAAAALLAAAQSRPEWVETFYSRGIYPVLSLLGSRLTKLAPFSVAEGCVAALALGLPTALIVQLIRRRVTARGLLSFAATALAAAALGYAALVGLWGLNYARVPLARNLGYREGTPTAAELEATLMQERDAVNSVLKSGRIRFSGRRSVPPAKPAEMREKLMDGYRALSEKSRLFNRNSVLPKPVLLSVPWSYTGTEGIFIPLTFEPCYSTATPDFVQAFDMAHETAHFKGFAREDEANFVAWLADTANPEPYFQYAAHLMAFCYLSNALNETDPALWKKAVSGLDGRAWDDIDGYNDYIDRISGPVADAASHANDQYLKAQGQQQGTLSYNLFVTLLVERRRTVSGG